MSSFGACHTAKTVGHCGPHTAVYPCRARAKVAPQVDVVIFANARVWYYHCHLSLEDRIGTPNTLFGYLYTTPLGNINVSGGKRGKKVVEGM